MKRNIFLFSIMLLFVIGMNAQNDTMYVLKNGEVIGKHNVNTEIDSIIFYDPFTPDSTVTDADGNIYKIVTIGTQKWIKENLKTTKYNDGSAIPSETNDSVWANLTTPAYCWIYNDSINFKEPYGALYNWYTVNTNKLCPTGWHVPDEADWTTLFAYLGEAAGGKLKETGNIHWGEPNTGATDEVGFTAIPAGDREPEGSFSGISNIGAWWRANEVDDFFACYFYLYSKFDNTFRGNITKRTGFSVRCVIN